MGLIGGIAAVATIGGSVLSSSSKNKQAQAAADATKYGSDQAAAVTRENYDKSAAALAPWQQSGLRANSALDAMLGISAPAQQQLPAQQPNAMAQYQGGQYQGGINIPGLAEYLSGQIPPGMTPAQRDAYYAQMGNLAYPAAGTQGLPTQQPTQPAANPAAGFQQYIQNSDYGFKLSEGGNAVNSDYAGAGTLQSGAAMKALEDYRQNLQQGYRGEYMGALGNQQSLGSAAASAQAGVAQNVGNSLAQIYQNSGANQANAALSKTNGLANGLGAVGGGLFGFLGR